MSDKALVDTAPADSNESILATLATLTPPVSEIKPVPWSSHLQSQIKAGKTNMSFAPPEAEQYLRLETGWVADPYVREEWTPEQQISIGTRKTECFICYGNRQVDRPYHGELTGIRVTFLRPCPCIGLRLFYHQWMNPAIVPSDYRNVGLGTLHNYWRNFPTFVRQEGKLEGLQALIDTVRAYPHNCYLLSGPAGSGKTTLMVAAYQRALGQWAARCFYEQKSTRAVWKVNASALSDQFRAWELRKERRDDDTGAPTPLPDVTVEQFFAAKNAGFVPCVFIDELDKFKMDSDFQAKKFHQLIDAVQSNGGQVFASSNLGLKAIADALGQQYGPAIVRRLVGPRLNPDNPGDPGDPEKGGFFIDFWAGKITQNYTIEMPGFESARRKPGSGFLPREEFAKKKQAERDGEVANAKEAARTRETPTSPETPETPASPGTPTGTRNPVTGKVVTSVNSNLPPARSQGTVAWGGPPSK